MPNELDKDYGGLHVHLRGELVSNGPNLFPCMEGTLKYILLCKDHGGYAEKFGKGLTIINGHLQYSIGDL